MSTIKEALAAKGISLGTSKDLRADPRVAVTIIKTKPATGLVWLGRTK